MSRRLDNEHESDEQNDINHVEIIKTYKAGVRSALSDYVSYAKESNTYFSTKQDEVCKLYQQSSDAIANIQNKLELSSNDIMSEIDDIRDVTDFLYKSYPTVTTAIEQIAELNDRAGTFDTSIDEIKATIGENERAITALNDTLTSVDSKVSSYDLKLSSHIKTTATFISEVKPIIDHVVTTDTEQVITGQKIFNDVTVTGNLLCKGNLIVVGNIIFNRGFTVDTKNGGSIDFSADSYDIVANLVFAENKTLPGDDRQVALGDDCRQVAPGDDNRQVVQSQLVATDLNIKFMKVGNIVTMCFPGAKSELIMSENSILKISKCIPASIRPNCKFGSGFTYSMLYNDDCIMGHGIVKDDVMFYSSIYLDTLPINICGFTTSWVVEDS